MCWWKPFCGYFGLIVGEPFAPGWITPSIPLVIVFLTGYGAGLDAIRAMTALALVVSGLFLLFAVTGLGKRFFTWVPVEWFAAKKATNKLFALMASMSMLVGFIVAGIVGPLSGEFSFDIKMGIFVPPFLDAIKAVHPFSIGWPSMDMFLSALPLALMVYVIVFSDLVLANTLLDEADKVRKDEKLVTDTTRTHYTIFFRNISNFNLEVI